MWGWIGAVVAFIGAALAVDLFVFNRRPHEVSRWEAVATSAAWIGVGLGFGLVVWAGRGAAAAGEYYTVFLLEKGLSADNLFVFALLFGYFAVPPDARRRVLFWGVLGAIATRAVFIAVGAAILTRFAWTGFVFGGVLLYGAWRMWNPAEEAVHPDHNPVLRFVRRLWPMSDTYDGARFFTRVDARRVATPLLAVLVVVETTDALLAVDSISASLAITRDTFVVFAANAFAVLGLRALFFVLADALDRFWALPRGLAVISVFVGIKLIAEPWVSVPVWTSLAVVAGVIAGSVVWSLLRPRTVG